MNKFKMFILGVFALFFSVCVRAADYASVSAAATALDDAAGTTTTSYLSWVTLGIGAILVGVAVWALRRGLKLRA